MPKNFSGGKSSEKFPEPDDNEKWITLCGSTRFKEKYQETFELLLEKGWFVRSVECFGHKENLDFPEGFKDELDRIHKEKILESDAIFVINPDGYVGDSTESEIEFAKEHDRNIYYLEEATEEEREVRKKSGKNY